MNGTKIGIGTGIVFTLAVLVPGIILGIIALRTISQEEAYLENSFRGTLLSEVLYTRTLLQSELEVIQEELREAISPGSVRLTGSILTSLCSLPFMLAPDRTILIPTEKQSSFAAAGNGISTGKALEYRKFRDRYGDFFLDRYSIPVYQNIAVAYKETVLETTVKPARSVSQNVTEIGAEKQTEEKSMVSEELMPPKAIAEVREWAGRTGSESPAQAVPDTRRSTKKVETQEAISLFNQNESLREKVYRQAEEEGRETLIRNVAQSGVEAKEAIPESVFISAPGLWSDIIAEKDYGIVPRYIEDDLQYLFWQKGEDGTITGCLIDTGVLNTRLISRMPELYTSIRILALLDETGRPVVMPGEQRSRDWRLSFVAAEVSEMLPHWEIAAYLTDPETISKQAGFISIVLFVLILMLLTSLTAGGLVTLRTVYREADLARKKTTFVANVSHELKTPLTSIRMFSEMLLDRKGSDPVRERKYLEIIGSESVRLTRLINKILDFSRISSGKRVYKKEPADIVSLTRDIWEECLVGLEAAGFSAEFSSAVSKALCSVDEEAYKQVILNLVSNAEKYSRDRKEILLSIEYPGKRPWMILIRVLDRGIGVSKKHRAGIFREFYRADDSLAAPVSGSGLGLAIARKITRDHGGDIVFSPREDGGSCFTVRLPALQDASVPCFRTETDGNVPRKEHV